MDSLLTDRLTTVGMAVLEALAEYRFLTVDQMLRLGVAKDRGHLGKVLSSLQRTRKKQGRSAKSPGEIGAQDYGTEPGKGRLPILYYLTPLGADLLGQVDKYYEGMYVPRTVRMFYNDFHHKLGTLDINISLNLFERQRSIVEVHDLRRYFDWSQTYAGNKPQPHSRLVVGERRNGEDLTITPDLIFNLVDQKGVERPCVLEFLNGRDTKRALNQIKRYADALSEGNLNRALDFPLTKGIRILLVFSSSSLREAITQRAKQDDLIREYLDHFWLSELDYLNEESFRDFWVRFDSGKNLVRLW